MKQSLKWRNVVSLMLSLTPLGIRPALSHYSTIAIVMLDKAIDGDESTFKASHGWL